MALELKCALRIFYRYFRENLSRHSCDICTCDKYKCLIYNDNYNKSLLLYKMSTYVHTCVCAIVTVANHVKNLVVFGTCKLGFSNITSVW